MNEVKSPFMQQSHDDVADLISRQAAIDVAKDVHNAVLCCEVSPSKSLLEVVKRLESLPTAEPRTYGVLCALADRECPFQGKEYAWCLTCPHISEEDRALVKKAVAEPKTGWTPIYKGLPEEERKTYLVQLDDGYMCSCRWTDANRFWTDLLTDWHWNIMDIPKYSKVVAWMDLEPYTENGGEEE